MDDGNGSKKKSRKKKVIRKYVIQANSNESASQIDAQLRSMAVLSPTTSNANFEAHARIEPE